MRNLAIALGNFDGIHLAHKKVIENAVEYKTKGFSPCVLTFKTHTLSVLKNSTPPKIVTDSLRNNIYEKMGVEDVIKLDFQAVVNLTPEQFIKDILIEKYNVKVISCGFNYRFGKNGIGDVNLLKEIAYKYNLEVVVAEEIDFENLPISSTRIRSLINDGEISKANQMLSEPFAYDFLVSVGDRRGGAVLGFPTINQEFPDEFVKPRFGVYVGRAFVEQKAYPIVVNFGIRPTFGTPKPRSEGHIIGYSGDLYGKKVKVELLDFIRPEVKFNGLDQLKEQIAKDVQSTKNFFAE